ncbi:MAG: Txe/YoeB family addiction module toxin [Fusobacteriaceae bacterium]
MLKRIWNFGKNLETNIFKKRIDFLIEDISEHPYEGIGKPHALKYELSGSWAREIDKKDRIVYRVKDDNTVEIHSLRGHYSDK